MGIVPCLRVEGVGYGLAFAGSHASRSPLAMNGKEIDPSRQAIWKFVPFFRLVIADTLKARRCDSD
jgi:hypothetical protein